MPFSVRRVSHRCIRYLLCWKQYGCCGDGIFTKNGGKIVEYRVAGANPPTEREERAERLER